jgi:hypothetical protein
MTWLLSTREAWGGWHNEIGTANAVRALLKAGAFGNEKASRITVRLNGKELRTIQVDPKDPFLSSAKLAHIEITGATVTGDNTIEVAYDGNLEASVLVDVREWGVAGNVTKQEVVSTRELPAKIAVNQPAPVSLSFTGNTAGRMALIEQGLPANAVVVVSSLDDLIRNRKILSYSMRDSVLVLTIILPAGNTDLRFQITGTAPGTAAFPGLKMSDTATGDMLSVCADSTLVVE